MKKGLISADNYDYTPSKELADFLRSGEPPVYAGFGSVLREDEKERIAQLIVQALHRSGKRGTICGMGEKALRPGRLLHESGSIAFNSGSEKPRQKQDN